MIKKHTTITHNLIPLFIYAALTLMLITLRRIALTMCAVWWLLLPY